jgi:hypothetical protein
MSLARTEEARAAQDLPDERTLTRPARDEVTGDTSTPTSANSAPLGDAGRYRAKRGRQMAKPSSERPKGLNATTATDDRMAERRAKAIKLPVGGKTIVAVMLTGATNVKESTGYCANETTPPRNRMEIGIFTKDKRLESGACCFLKCYFLVKQQVAFTQSKRELLRWYRHFRSLHNSPGRELY